MPGPERFRVLVVQSSETDAASLVEDLSPHFEVVACRSAGDALARISELGAHVVCSDYEMPDMDGVRFLRRVASLPDAPCFLLITTAAEMKDQKLDGLSGVIGRPYDVKVLVERVKRLSRIAETRRKVSSARSAIDQGLRSR